MSLALIVVGRNDPVMMERARAQVVDTLAPALDAVSRPMVMVEEMARNAAAYLDLRKENERLRTENALLAQWQNAALTMENENRELRSLLNYKAEPSMAYIAARVIADAGGPYVRSLIVTAGKMDDARVGMAAMTGDCLIGRVVEVGDWSSRILLITDLNSRIPVVITGSGDHAILAGDNSNKLKLLYLPQDADLQTGARIITSGHGGVFPPNLPVAAVVGIRNGTYEIVPLAPLGRVNQVRLIDFNLKGGDFNPMAAKLGGATRTVN